MNMNMPKQVLVAQMSIQSAACSVQRRCHCDAQCPSSALLSPMCVAPVQLVEELFGVTIERTENSHTWHPDVQFYSLKKEGKLKAYFYLDPYSRPAGMNRSAVFVVQKTDITTEEVLLEYPLQP